MKVRYSILAAVFISFLVLINCGSDKTSGVDSDPPQASSLSVEYTGSKNSGTQDNMIEPISLRSNGSSNLRSNTASVSVTTTGKGCQVTANWTQCSSDDFASYSLYRSTNQFISSDTTSATRLTSVSSVSSTSYTDNTVSNATIYYYALKTTDESGLTSWSNEVDVTTPQSSESPSPSDLSLAFTGDSKANTVSSAISTLFSNDRTTVAGYRTVLSSQATGKSTCEVTATWTECPDGDFLSYTLYRSTSSGISQDTTSADNMGTFTSVSSTEYVDGAVDWETTYYYALITRDTQDLFAWSDEESITTPSSQGGDITVTEPTSSTVWGYGQTNTTVSWTGTTTTSVRIEIWQSGTKLDDFADWVPNTGSYTRAAALPASWGTGANYQIKVIDQDDSYGFSENFLLNGTIDVTTPTSSTLWTVGDTNTQVEWTGGGAQVKLQVWYEGEYVADYSGFITNTGSYTRSAPIPTTWSIGTHFRIRVVESGSTPDDGYSEEFRITDEVDVTNPTSSTSWAWGESGVTVSWDESYSDNVTIYVYKGGSSVATFAASVPNTGNYTRADAVLSSWGWGDDFQIKVVGNLGSSGYSDEFSIWAMDITEPNSSTIWFWEQANTEVHWIPGSGSNVRMEIWKDDSKVDDYCDWTPNDGSYTRSSAIPTAWGEGDNYQIRMIDDLGNEGWSEEFGVSSLGGSIVAWGQNNYGQCDVPSPNAAFISVAGGDYHSLGLKADGSIVTWGNGSPVPAPNEGFVAVAGGTHSLGLKDDGSIVAWGSNSHGQCDVPSPNTAFIGVAGGDWHSLGLKEDGSIVAWGSNEDGQCDVPAPNEGFVAVAAGYYHGLGLKDDGSIVAWGYNAHGQCDVPTPNEGFVAIAGGYGHSLGLKEDGSIVAWGRNYEGQCNVPSPNSAFVAVAGGYYHSLGLKEDGSIVAWGGNGDGQCNVPSPNSGFLAVSGGLRHSLGIQQLSK